MSDLKKFPKVRPLGHPDVEAITEPGTVYVLEKMDGANFRFGRDGDRILFGSRNVVYEQPGDMPGAFDHAIDYVMDRVDADDLREDVTYFGEAMHSHTLEYEWDDVPDVLAFAVYDHDAETFKSWPAVVEEFNRLSIPLTPIIETLGHDELTAEYNIPDSFYRDGTAEGVVFWHENTTRAKLRSDAFTEKHDSPTSESQDFDGHTVLVAQYCTEARIDKRINDLLDDGHTLGRELMGEGLPQAVSRDILEEHAHEIVSLNETVDLKDYRSLVAKRCLARVDDRLAANVSGVMSDE